nr:hypothetical protein [Tanacetum cinerariifolium]
MHRLNVDTLTPDLLAGPTYKLMRGPCTSLTELEYHLEETNRLRDSYQKENDEFLQTIDENMKRIIKEQVKGQVKEQVSRILPRIEQSVNAQLEAEMEGNKSIQRSNEQRNLYKALVDAYEADKIILDSNGETVILKKRRDDDDDQDEGPSAGSDRGSKRWREGKEPKSASAPLETATRSTGRSTIWSKSRQVSASESAFIEEPVQTTSQIKDPHIWCLKQYPHNLLQPLSLIPDNRGRHVILFAHFINNDLEYLRGGTSSRKYTTSVTKTKAADYGNIKWIEDLVPRTMWIQEPIDYDNHALWGDLDWISVRRDDDKIYKFKEGDFKRLRLQDIEDMLLLLVQGKLSNLTIEEHFTFNVSLRMFTRSIVIQRCVEDL